MPVVFWSRLVSFIFHHLIDLRANVLLVIRSSLIAFYLKHVDNTLAYLLPRIPLPPQAAGGDQIFTLCAYVLPPPSVTSYIRVCVLRRYIRPVSSLSNLPFTLSEH